ncbi:hypothetical protein BDV39DRAFT_113150 [Aspergillus sergii]|uniref:Uncharacterized protein n=1 Tax=Aspergillus sergii TaxID=1034303 RepID=A0A5N6WYB1_9EURO|nr:hypothetical protein BDV39DRAFT_113150 [Aspergillus sergii]
MIRTGQSKASFSSATCASPKSTSPRAIRSTTDWAKHEVRRVCGSPTLASPSKPQPTAATVWPRASGDGAGYAGDLTRIWAPRRVSDSIFDDRARFFWWSVHAPKHSSQSLVSFYSASSRSALHST